MSRNKAPDPACIHEDSRKVNEQLNLCHPLGRSGEVLGFETWLKIYLAERSRDLPRMPSTYLLTIRISRSCETKNRRFGTNSINSYFSGKDGKLWSLCQMWERWAGFLPVHSLLIFKKLWKTTPLTRNLTSFFLVGERLGFPGLTWNEGVEFSYSFGLRKSLILEI